MSEHLHVVEGDETTFDASNPAHVRRKQQAAKREDRKLDVFLSAMMEQREGRDWMWWLLGQTGIYQSSFSNSALVMAHKEGARNLGLTVTAELVRVCAPQYMLMMQERQGDV